MTTPKPHDPMLDLSNLKLLVEDYRLLLQPHKHDTVRGERSCARCRLLKNAERSIKNLEDHREKVNRHLNYLLEDQYG